MAARHQGAPLSRNVCLGPVCVSVPRVSHSPSDLSSSSPHLSLSKRMHLANVRKTTLCTASTCVATRMVPTSTTSKRSYEM